MNNKFAHPVAVINKSTFPCLNIKHIFFLLGASALVVTGTHATELIYSPVNPAFGGNPLNGAALLNAAQAQNKKKDPNDALSRQGTSSPLQQFNDTLQRSVLSQLAAAATSQVINGGRLVPGTVETNNFNITVSDLGGGTLQITTTDKVTGASTSFQVSQ